MYWGDYLLQCLFSAGPTLAPVGGEAERTLSISSHCPCACGWWGRSPGVVSSGGSSSQLCLFTGNSNFGYPEAGNSQIHKQAFTHVCCLLNSLAIMVLVRPDLLWHELMVTAAKSLSQVHFWTCKWGSHSSSGTGPTPALVAVCNSKGSLDLRSGRKWALSFLLPGELWM